MNRFEVSSAPISLAPMQPASTLRALAASAAPAIPPGAYVVKTGGPPIPMRLAPSTDSATVAMVPDGTVVQATGEVTNDYATVTGVATAAAVGGRGYIAEPALTPVTSGTPVTRAPVGTPSGAPTTPTSPTIADAGPSSSPFPILPVLAGAALLWFFVVEQKKKGRR